MTNDELAKAIAAAIVDGSFDALSGDRAKLEAAIVGVLNAKKGA